MRLARLLPALALGGLLLGCTDQPTAVTDVALPVFDVVPADLVDPPWAKNFGERIIGPAYLGPFLLQIPCRGETLEVEAELWWAVWSKVKETGSGNIVTNNKVWWYPYYSRMWDDFGNEWLLTKETQSWNWITYHVNGVTVQRDNINAEFVNPETGQKIKGTTLTVMTIYPNGDVTYNEKKFDYKCIGAP